MLYALQNLLAHLPTNFFKLLAWLALAALIFMPLERLLARRPQAAFRQGWLGDIGYYFISGLLPAFVLLFTTHAISQISHLLLPKAWFSLMTGLPLLTAAFLTLIVGDLAYYWAHRWSHEIPLLWKFHAIHHSPKQLDWLVNTRAHPIDTSYTRTVVFIPICLLGLSQGAAGETDFLLLAFALLNRFWSTFVHANVNLRLRALDGILSTPFFHHWHHTNDGPQLVNKNYAAVLPIWDKLFGSYLMPNDFPASYGIDQTLSTGVLSKAFAPLATNKNGSEPAA
ncbi:sterol desaturase family protein [Roseateles koreensis]|uniref:Sterol desaturase family protein n=1 Tax=Roseateles koreensis TaxID=2987526 RepID=A0ABT5KQE7_9BURK|nr:sterol desaturase family protein [Roseateles koreensis]MDC8784598.1 sterol desaturase family protein [Roseateles koreensis]